MNIVDDGSRVTNKMSKLTFPPASGSAQKTKFYEVADVHKQGGVVRDASFYQPILYNVNPCLSGQVEGNGLYGTVSDVPLGNGKTVQFLNPKSPNPINLGDISQAPDRDLRTLFYIGLGLIGLALILAVVHFFAPRVYGSFAKFVVGLVVFLVALGIVLIIMDRSDTF